MCDPREFQDVESIFSGICSHVPSHLAIIPTKAGDLKYGVRLEHRETFLLIHVLHSILRIEKLFTESKSSKWNSGARLFRAT